MADELRATKPKHPTLAQMAAALTKAHEFASKPFGYANPPGEMVSSLLGLPAIAKTAERAAYGEPLTSGSGQTLHMLPETTEALMSSPGAVAGMGKLAKATKNMPVGLAIKPSGGDWMASDLDEILNRIKTPGKYGSRPPEQLLADMQARFTPEAIARLSPSSQEHIQKSFADLQAKAAPNKWLDTQLRNYIRNEMGSPEDPIRKAIDAAVEKSQMQQALDQKKLNKLGAKIQEAKNAGADDATIRNMKETYKELANDMKQKQEAIISRSVPATKEAMEYGSWAPESLYQDRINAGYPGMGFAKSEPAMQWETITDTGIDPAKAGHISGYWNVPEEKELLESLPLGRKIYRPAFNTEDIGFNRISEGLREALNAESGLPPKLMLTPESMNRLSVPQAVERINDIEQWKAADAAAKAKAARGNAPVHKEYPEGYRWIELNTPGVFSDESKAMGHSVRGYEPPEGHPDWITASGSSGYDKYGLGGWEAIKSGKAKVYSLVDPKGNPHATIETNKTYKTPEDVEQAITQVKGKSNEAPSEEYLPYIQDFIKSGKWTDVGDLKNTGLTKKDGKYFTQDEISDDLLSQLGVPDVPQYAKGGTVKTPTLEQMRQFIMAHMARAKMMHKADGGAVDIATVGINEAPDMDVKQAIMPAATTATNTMPVGGVDFQPLEPGMQLAPGAPAPQPGQAPGAPGQPQGAPGAPPPAAGMPGQGMPQAPQNASPVAQGAPPSNILSRTPQGNMLQAMKPMARMKNGGKVKGIIKEKVKVSPTGDAMMYELTRAQRYTKKVK